MTVFLIGAGLGVLALVTGYRLYLGRRLTQLQDWWRYRTFSLFGIPNELIVFVLIYFVLGFMYEDYRENFSLRNHSTGEGFGISLFLLIGFFVFLPVEALDVLGFEPRLLARWLAPLGGLALSALWLVVGYLAPFGVFNLVKRLHYWFVPAPVERAYRNSERLSASELARDVADASKEKIERHEPAWVSENYTERMKNLRRKLMGKGKRYRERVSAQARLRESEAAFIEDLADEIREGG